VIVLGAATGAKLKVKRPARQASLLRFNIVSHYGTAMLPIVPVQPGGGG
jgi:hypothetical protein